MIFTKQLKFDFELESVVKEENDYTITYKSIGDKIINSDNHVVTKVIITNKYDADEINDVLHDFDVFDQDHDPINFTEFNTSIFCEEDTDRKFCEELIKYAIDNTEVK